MEAARNPWPALGTLLVRDGAVSPEQLEIALLEKRMKPELRLGEILVTNGFATRLQVTRVLAEQHDLDFVELEVARSRSRQPCSCRRISLVVTERSRSGSWTTATSSSPSPIRQTSCSPTTSGSLSGCRCACALHRPRRSNLRSHDSTTGHRSTSRTSSRALPRPRMTPPFSTSITTHPQSSSSTVRSPKRSTLARPTFTSRRRRGASSFGFVSTASCAS